MLNRLRLDLVITLSALDLYLTPLTSPRSCRQSVVCYHRHAIWTHAVLNAATMQSLLWVAAYGILVSLFFVHRLIWAYTYIVEEGTFFYLVRSRLYWLYCPKCIKIQTTRNSWKTRIIHPNCGLTSCLVRRPPICVRQECKRILRKWILIGGSLAFANARSVTGYPASFWRQKMKGEMW